MDWASKYRSKHVTDVVGKSSALHLMVEWARSWTTESKPLLLHGKPGTGKTSSVYALAADFSWEVIELNASDQRTRDVIGQAVLRGEPPRDAKGQLTPRSMALIAWAFDPDTKHRV